MSKNKQVVQRKKGGEPTEEINEELREQYGLTKDEYMDIKAAFDVLDVDKENAIKKEVFLKSLRELDIKVDDATKDELLEAVDKNKNDMIEFEEFFEFIASSYHKYERNSREELEAIYKLFTESDNLKDQIDAETLKKIGEKLGENCEDEVVQDMIKRADTNLDEKVSFEEFYAIMTRP